MHRRKFLQQTFFLAGGLIFANQLPAGTFIRKGNKLKGRVLSRGKGISNVIVSDGYNVVATDRKGRYAFEAHPDARTVFISTPSGYAFNNENGISRHYRQLADVNLKRPVDFDLVPLGQDDIQHQFIVWADPQVKNANDVEKMMNESVPDVQKFVAAAGSGALIHGITVGDIVWDEHKLYPDYNRAVEKMGIPFFQCLGNHDMDYTNGSDASSDDTFQKTYGPTYYSFNRGMAHYVVMDDVRYLGKDRQYDGYVSQDQLDWLKNDLSFVPNDRLIIVCLHIPVHSGVKNNSELYAVLGDRNVHIMSGHTHYHRNVIKGNIYEHNHGTVCGAWWTGAICEDGTPNGYGVYKVTGNQLQWHYQATGLAPDHQLNLFIDNAADEKRLQVNIWNHDPAWKTEYWIDGVKQGELQKADIFDPQAYSTLKGPDLPKPRGFAEPKKTGHMFQAPLPSSAKEIKVIATDRFGKTYSAIHAA